MIFWRVIELIVVIAIIVIIATQILIPLWKGTKLFPKIRRRKLEAQMKQVKETIETQSYMEELQRESEKIKADNPKRKGN